MPADPLTLAALCLAWGATYLVHSTLLVAAVWLFLKLRPQASHVVREVLWKTALVGGVATAVTQILLIPDGPFGGVTWKLPGVTHGASEMGAVAESSEAAAARGLSDESAIHGGLASSDAAREIWLEMPLPSELDADADVDPVAAAATGVFAQADFGGRNHRSTEASAVSARTWSVVLLLCTVGLAAGAIVVGIARSLWQTMALTRKLAECVPIEKGPAHNLLDELRRLIPRAPPVRLLAAPDDAEPAAFGVRQWTIVLPHRAARDLSEDELRSLIAHELAHLVRGDSLWLLISRVVCSCLAFQPLNHLARREWQRAAEFLCDSWAVGRTGAPLALARCLTEVAGWRLAGRGAAAMLAVTGRKSGLVDRIERLLDARPDREPRDDARLRHRILLLGGLGLALVAWCAPRVHLAAAGTHPAEDAGSRAALFGADSGSSTRAVGHLPPIAERDSTSPESGALSSIAHSSGSPTGAAGQIDEAQGQFAAARIPDLLAALDHDLAALEAELSAIEPLLKQTDGGPRFARLAAHLRTEISRLKERRQKLQVAIKSSRR